MRTNKLASMIGSVLVLLALQAVASAQVPEITIPDGDLQGDSLPSVYVSQIDKHINKCLATLSAKDDKGWQQAANGLSLGYQRYDSVGYRASYAKRMAALGAPALAKLEPIPQAQLALALSQVPEPDMVPCLEVMIRHNSPAVRYLGWMGYVSAPLRSRLIGQTASLNAMMDLVAKRAKEETSPVVFGPILDMLRIPGEAKAAQKRAWETLQQLWPALCLQTMSGQAEISRACRRGVVTIEYYSQIVDAKEKNKLLQMLVNMMYSASRAYFDAGGEGLVADINGQLARDCEALVATLSGVQKSPVQTALAVKNPADRATDVPLAVLKWATDLKSKGVVDPKTDLMPPTPAAPSSGPAKKAGDK